MPQSAWDKPSSSRNGFLRLPKVFIEDYLPVAPPIYLKVLIVAWEPCYGNSTASWLGYQKIAERANVCKSTVKKAMAYWTARGVVEIVHRFLRDAHDFRDFRTERSDEYSIQTSNLIVFKMATDSQKTDDEHMSGGLRPQPQGSYADTPGGGYTHDPKEDLAMNHTIELDNQTVMAPLNNKETDCPSVEPIRSETRGFRDEPTKAAAAIAALAEVTKRLPDDVSKPERNHMKYLLAHYQLPDVLDALKETEIYNRQEQPVKSFIRFATKILKNWATEGKHTSEETAPKRASVRPLLNLQPGRGHQPIQRDSAAPSYYGHFAHLEEAMLDSLPMEA